jgi:leucyl aminopeptidase (aminopeptidase T)
MRHHLWLARLLDGAGLPDYGRPHLTGDPVPHLLDDVDPAKAAAFPVEEAIVAQEAVLSQQLRWTVVAAPNPGWAQEVFGEPDVECLWEAVATAMRLDEADSVASWQERDAELAARGRALDALELAEMRYNSAAADLTVGLVPGAGGPAVAAMIPMVMPTCRTSRPRRSLRALTGAAPTARSALRNR